MNRRDFLATSSAAATVAGIQALSAVTAQAQPEATAGREYYELRFFSLKPGQDGTPFLNYLETAALPALNRLKIMNVGVFTELNRPGSPFLCVLTPYPSMEAFIATPGRLAADKEYQEAAKQYLNLPSSSPAYDRIDSTLLVAFEGMPRLVLPATTAEKKPRIFELRTYESHSEAAGKKKIEMFNKGEIEIMRRVEMAPVFFGEMLVGPRMPNLTYMLSGDNMDVHKSHWGAFGGDPEWRKMSSMPEYANSAIVSKITNKFLAPLPFSQI